MNNLPPKLRAELAADPFYKTCARYEALHDHECLPNPLNRKLIEWEHAIIFGGKQVQARYAIVPICWWAHSGPGLNKKMNVWIALNRATNDELLGLSKAMDYFLYRDELNKYFGGAYVEPIFEQLQIQY